MKTHHPERGTALIVSLVVVFTAALLAYSALTISTAQQKDLQRGAARIQARALAESGVHRALGWLRNVMQRSSSEPFVALDTIMPPDSPEEEGFLVSKDEPLIRNERRFGTFTVSMRARGAGDEREYVVTSTGYVPNSQRAVARTTVQAVVRANFGPTETLDHAYFLNNWGWFNGGTIFADGNVRSNGQFDCGGRNPTITGTPRYENAVGSDLQGYIDDNHDGLADGNDGGIFSGWEVTEAEHVKGNGGKTSNQHAFSDPLSMPDLHQLKAYEKRALESASSIKLRKSDGTELTVCDEVLGDEVGELQNLVLIGTPEEPIVIQGLVVVRGDLIIKGTVTGQGSIFAGGNVYIPDNLRYLNPPSSPRPENNTEAATEAWLSENQGADFLGLFSDENLVMGDFTNSDWDYNVGLWLDNPLNESIEDAGIDGIPYTRPGRDGITGTEDDDVLEGDGKWTVEYYSELDEELGLIPDGFGIGDPIPGSGEDLDGDGEFDGRIQTEDFQLSSPLTSDHWSGNLPPGVTYGELATMGLLAVDGVLGTNHAAGLASWGRGDLVFYGGLVSRNESILYATRSLQFHYDRRLLGGGMAELMPHGIRKLEITAWKVEEGRDGTRIHLD